MSTPSDDDPPYTPPQWQQPQEQQGGWQSSWNQPQQDQQGGWQSSWNQPQQPEPNQWQQQTPQWAGYQPSPPTPGNAIASLILGIVRAVMDWPSYDLDMLERMDIPVVAGFAIVAAGLFQASRRKLELLRHCRRAGSLDPGVAAAIGQGLRLGFACCASCAGLTALLLVGGAMDLRAMAVVALAITAERLASAGERIACAVGAIMLGAGAVQLASALWQL